MSRPARVALSAVSVLAAAALLVALPYIVGAGWDRIGAALGRLHPLTVAGLAALWLAGLWAYTYVLAASLPGLSHQRAFLLNAAGSGVSNLLPFGGAAGVAVTFAMARGWGHRLPAITVSALVTGIWNVMSRLLLPVVGIAALLAAGEPPDRGLTAVAGTACAALLAIALALAGTLRSESMARGVDRLLRRLAARTPGRAAGALRRAGGALLDLRHKTVAVIRTGWPALSLGMFGYLLLQGLLLVACLAAVGARPGAAEVVAVFAMNRMLTVAVVTPSGTGISEAGTAALLVHFGVDPAAGAAAVLLYTFFTFIIEIPLGGIAWVTWTFGRAGRPFRPAPGYWSRNDCR